MSWCKAIIHLIIPIIFKRKENLDNNYLPENHQNTSSYNRKMIAYLEEILVNRKY
jgi:hypothetical protein